MMEPVTKLAASEARNNTAVAAGDERFPAVEPEFANGAKSRVVHQKNRISLRKTARLTAATITTPRTSFCR